MKTTVKYHCMSLERLKQTRSVSESVGQLEFSVIAAGIGK